MTLEQELVRLFGNYARNSAGYQVPYSACTVISSQIGSPGIKVCHKLSIPSVFHCTNRKKPKLYVRCYRHFHPPSVIWCGLKSTWLRRPSFVDFFKEKKTPPWRVYLDRLGPGDRRFFSPVCINCLQKIEFTIL